MADSPVDAVDRAILFHLQMDDQQPIKEIAETVNVSGNTVRNRIEKMEEEGVIAGYRAEVNYDNAGIQHYFQFICSARVSARDQLAAEARDLAGVVDVITLMTGTNNITILAAAEEKDEITDLAYDIDSLGIDIEREHLVRNHHQQPYSGFRLPTSEGNR